MEVLEDTDLQTFRNEALKLLSVIQSRVEEMSLWPQKPQQQTHSRSYSATSTFVLQTFQQPHQPAPAAGEYILTILETQMPARARSFNELSRAKWQPKDSSNLESR